MGPRAARLLAASAAALAAAITGAALAPPGAAAVDDASRGDGAERIDPVAAGFTSAAVAGGRVRATVVVPHVQCPPDGVSGVSFALEAFAPDGDLAGAARLTFTCSDGTPTSGLGLTGADSAAPTEPDIHWGPADPLRFTIVDLGTVTEVRVRNLQNGHRDAIGSGREALASAFVGGERTYIDTGYAPTPPYDGFDGFSDVRLGRAGPSTWTRLDLVDQSGEIEIATVRDGRRAFDLIRR